jgi:hypothetical protein
MSIPKLGEPQKDGDQRSSIDVTREPLVNRVCAMGTGCGGGSPHGQITRGGMNLSPLTLNEHEEAVACRAGRAPV